jgi:exopolyphosphatase/guanosine-5'-triphosphate,3'-diphosphate pyrophosphatase
MSRKRRRAVIDIGTNSVKLLVAEVAGRDVWPLCEESKQTRLGQGFYQTRRLQREPVAQTVAAITRFVRTARDWKAQSVRIIATSAARDAKNPKVLLNAVTRATGLRVEIISGKQEADWAFQGVTTDPALANLPLLLLDVGGGSTEFILGHDQHKHFRHSFPLGTVRLLEKFPPDDPPKKSDLSAVRKWLRSFLKKRVKPRLGPELRSEAKLDPRHGVVQLVGTGGTASILARMQARMDGFDRDRLERTRLTLRGVRAHAKKLWGLSLARRQRIVGLPPKRADVILMGVLIYEAVMEEFGFKELRVSTRGLRFAAVMDKE